MSTNIYASQWDCSVYGSSKLAHTFMQRLDNMDLLICPCSSFLKVCMVEFVNLQNVAYRNWILQKLEKHSKIVQRPYTLTHCDIPQTLSRDVTQWFLLQNPAPGLQVFQAPVPYSETDSDFHLCPIPTYFKKDHATNPHSATQRRYLDREVNIIAEIYLCDYETHVDNFISKVYLVLISWENELNL